MDISEKKIITLKKITKFYPTRSGRRLVLNSISFRLEHGDRLGILGINGSGKSTLIRIIGGVEYPTSGEIIFHNMTISWPLAFQGGFVGSLTGLDNLKFVCRVYDVPFDEVIEKVVEFSELGEYLKEPIFRYSSGMKAKLAFAISLAVNFDCYLIDEVTAVGDKSFKKKCHDALLVERNKSIIMVSHSNSVIKEYCNRFAVLNSGELFLFTKFYDASKFYDDQFLKNK